MIREEEVVRIGIFNKPHGIKGELQFSFTDDVFDGSDCDYLVCLMDGILVPFFMEEYRFRTDTTALVKLEGIDTAEQARRMTNVEVFFPIRYIPEREEELPAWQSLTGFMVRDRQDKVLGRITAVDDSTLNILLQVMTAGGQEVLLPAHAELIIDFNRRKRLIAMDIPDGLI